MSERDRNDDFNETQFELGGVEADATKNRPATGSAFAESTEELNLDWKGSSAATDFLGIEGEVRIDDVPAPIGSGLDTSGTAGLPADSWLHGIEGREEEFAQAAAAANTPPARVERLQLDGIRKQVAEPKSRSLAWMLVAASCVIALAAGGAWYWKTQRAGHDLSTPVDVAKPRPPEAQKPFVPPSTTPGVTTNPGVTPANGGGLEPNAETIPVVASDPLIDTETLPPDSLAEVTPTITFPDPNSTEPAMNSGSSAEPISLPTNLRVPPPSSAPIPGAVRRATEADFAHLWREQAVPMEAITGDRKMRTINVGQVRVMLDSGEYFEGGLYAVGQHRVWLDLDLGRIAFEAAAVRDITRIATPASATSIGKRGQDLSGLPHVEVRLPGGWMAGRLVGREGKVVTLVTDAGIRMVIETEEVRPITARKTRVLGTVEKLGGFTGKAVEAPTKP